MSGRARVIPGWAVVSAAVAPVALIGGWTLGASRQPPGYSAVHDTISALAARGATDRWIMTAGLAALGGCHLVTALGLRPAQRGGRALLALGGLATLAVAAAPQPAHGSSQLHVGAASVGFLTLSLWAVFASGSTRPVVLRRRTGAAVSAVLLALLGWLVLQLGGGAQVGLVERLLAGAQSLWPLVVVLMLRAGGGPAARMTG